MRDYSDFLESKKLHSKRGVSVNRDIDWWVSYVFRKSSAFFFLFAIIFVVVSVFYIKKTISDRQSFPLSNVEIKGDIVITTRADVLKSMQEFNKKSFFDIDLQEVTEKLESLKWVEKVEAVRKWPSTLELKITERKPTMRWGESELVDDKGNKFANIDNSIFANLPKLSGPDGYEKQVVDNYYKYIKLFAGYENMKMTKFNLSKSLSWQVFLESGVVVKFGRENFLHRLSMLKTAREKNKIPDLNKVEIIDLRAASGFVIKWKPEVLEKENNEDNKVINASLETRI